MNRKRSVIIKFHGSVKVSEYKSIIKNAMRKMVKIRGLCRALPVHDAFTFSMDLKPG